jgi:hypothetical protein
MVIVIVVIAIIVAIYIKVQLAKGRFSSYVWDVRQIVEAELNRTETREDVLKYVIGSSIVHFCRNGYPSRPVADTARVAVDYYWDLHPRPDILIDTLKLTTHD